MLKVATWRESEDSRPLHAMAARKRFVPAKAQDCPRPSARRVIRTLAAIALGVAGPTSATAMTFKVISPDQGQPALSMSGEILPGDTARALLWLIRLSKDNMPPRLFLNSPGGNVLEAMRLAGLIHGAAMPVFVQAGDMCASACFLLFAASPSRHAAPDAMIGVHSTSFEGDENRVSLMLDTALARAARAFGVPPDVIGRMVTTGPSDMAWLTADELQEMDVHPIGATEQESPVPEPTFDRSKLALAKPIPPEAQVVPPAGGTDEPWDGITYRPAQLGPGAPSIDPESQVTTAQPTLSVAAVRGANDKPDYVARGVLATPAPAYIPGR